MHIRAMEGLLKAVVRMSCAFAVLATAGMVAGQTSTNLLAATPLRSAPSQAAPASRTSFAPIASDLDDKHMIRPGDKLSFRIEEDKEDPKVLPVTDSGEIELPYNLGRFNAANKTCRRLAQEIKTAVEKDYYHKATVHLGIDTVNAVRGKVFVQGQVTKPGPVTMPTDSPLTLSQALLLAGPPTQWAKLTAVRVVRKVGTETKTFVINADAFNRGRMESDVVLEPDDWVIVPERGVIFGGGN